MSTIGRLMTFCDIVVNNEAKIKDKIRLFYPNLFAIRRKMAKKPKEGQGKDLYIILNGPSLKTQDLSVLKGRNIMFVNRGFMHPLYKELQPKYHVFADAKLRNGVWPVTWLDEIFKLSPNIRIILPIVWYNHPTFARYKEDERIFWLDWSVPYYTMGVSGSCFSYAIRQGFKNIYFTGFDANSCAYDMIKSSDSHFYGADPELHNMSAMQHAGAMFATSLQFKCLSNFANYCKKKSIKVVNLTNGGLLDMFSTEQLI